MSHNHHHHDHGQIEPSNLNRAFILGIALNAIYVVAEFTMGLVYSSVGLISDAGHNLSDVASLVLALIAFKLSAMPADRNFTYGYKKSTVLVSLVNAVILLVAVFFIIQESISKILSPAPLQGAAISITAAIGVVINALTAFLFIKAKDKDLNVKGAYMHMLADTLVSIGVVVSGILIAISQWYILDGIIGIAIALIILFSTWDLLKDSVKLCVDAVPEGIDLEQIAKLIEQTAGVENVHHIHIWPISTTENALTAHVVLQDPGQMQKVKVELKEKLEEHNIHHSTLEFESKEHSCSHHELICDD